MFLFLNKFLINQWKKCSELIEKIFVEGHLKKASCKGLMNIGLFVLEEMILKQLMKDLCRTRSD